VALNAAYRQHKFATENSEKQKAHISLLMVLEFIRNEIKNLGTADVRARFLSESQVLQLYSDKDFKVIFVHLNLLLSDNQVKEYCSEIFEMLGFGDINKQSLLPE